MIKEFKDLTDENKILIQILHAQAEVQGELQDAMKAHGPMHSMHEGHSVIREEFEELWDEIVLKHPNRARVRKECIQLAAMALRFLVDVVPLTIAAPADAAEVSPMLGKTHSEALCR